MSATKMTYASLTRISDLEHQAFDIAPVTRDRWETGDYVVGEVRNESFGGLIELSSGRLIEVAAGDWVVGALGVRSATLEAVGSWHDIGDDGEIHCMTAAGLIGKTTSKSIFTDEPVHLSYRGHALRHDEKICMPQFASPASLESVTSDAISCPVVLLIGTSMSSGKTTSAKLIIRRLKQMGLAVAGAKLTGAGRYRDILAMHDAGADRIFDFVDAGLPSTVCSDEEYQNALRRMLCLIADSNPDVLVAEAGASPIEPYNGQLAIDGIPESQRCVVLCASDPYAVVGVTKGFGIETDLVTGVATSTSAGVAVLEKLVNSSVLNLTDPTSYDQLDEILCKTLGLSPKSSP